MIITAATTTPKHVVAYLKKNIVANLVGNVWIALLLRSMEGSSNVFRDWMRPIQGISRLNFSFALAIVILLWAKAGLAFSFSWTSTLIPVVIGFALLAYASPPVAAALFFHARNLLADISYAHEGVSALKITASVLVVTLLVTRWKDGTLESFLRGAVKQPMIIVVTGLFGVYVIGVVGALIALGSVGPDFSGEPWLRWLTQISSSKTDLVLNHLLRSHWVTFLAVGILACVAWTDLKIFFMAMALLIVAQLLTIPGWYYADYFDKVLMGVPVGLHVGQVNRSYLGYALTIASAVALALAVYSTTARWKVLLCIWSVFCGFIVYLAGSKGPSLAMVLVMGFLAVKTRKVDGKDIAPILVMIAAIVSVILIYLLFLVVIGSDWAAKQYVITMGEGSSFTIRVAFAKQTLELLTQRDFVSLLFGTGFGSSVRIPYFLPSGKFNGLANSHNLFLDLAVEVGVFGLVLFVVSGVLLIWVVLRELAKAQCSDRRVLETIVLSSVLVLLVKVSLAAQPYVEDLLALILGALIGCAVELRHAPHREPEGSGTTLAPQRDFDEYGIPPVCTRSTLSKLFLIKAATLKIVATSEIPDFALSTTLLTPAGKLLGAGTIERPCDGDKTPVVMQIGSDAEVTPIYQEQTV